MGYEPTTFRPGNINHSLPIRIPKCCNRYATRAGVRSEFYFMNFSRSFVSLTSRRQPGAIAAVRELTAFCYKACYPFQEFIVCRKCNRLSNFIVLKTDDAWRRGKKEGGTKHIVGPQKNYKPAHISLHNLVEVGEASCCQWLRLELKRNPLVGHASLVVKNKRNLFIGPDLDV